MYAYLDCASYQTYLKDHINRYQEEIKDLESKADSKNVTQLSKMRRNS